MRSVCMIQRNSECMLKALDRTEVQEDCVLLGMVMQFRSGIVLLFWI